MTFGKIVRRFSLYVGLAVAALVLLAAALAISVHTGLTIRAQWGWLAMYTVLLIWVVIKTYQRYWRRPAFWFALAGLLGIHLTLFIVLLRNFPEFKPLWYIPAVMAEGAGFGVTCGILLDRNRLRRGSR